MKINYRQEVSNISFPDKNCERELEVVHGEDDELLLPLPGGVAQLPVDQTRLNIKNINLKGNLGSSFPVGAGPYALSMLPSEASPF